MKVLRNLLFSFFSVTTAILIMSCNNPSSTNLSLVDQKEVEKLLNSPEEIDFEGRKYKLNIGFREASYQIVRGCPLFLCQSKLISPRFLSFALISSTYNSNLEFERRIKATSLWVIHKDSKFYFESTKIKIDNNIFSSGSIDISKDYDSKLENIGIVKFESENRTFYLKSKIFSH